MLGYSTAGLGLTAGRMIISNFPRGHPPLTAPTHGSDRPRTTGATRVDDPGTPNNGSPDYREADLGTNAFAVGGIAMNWRSNDTFWNLSLPFAFPFYGRNYSSVSVSSEGFLQFAGPNSPSSGVDGVRELAANVRIAPIPQRY